MSEVKKKDQFEKDFEKIHNEMKAVRELLKENREMISSIGAQAKKNNSTIEKAEQLSKFTFNGCLLNLD